jgi:hypothetical protein
MLDKHRANFLLEELDLCILGTQRRRQGSENDERHSEDPHEHDSERDIPSLSETALGQYDFLATSSE